MLTNIFYYNYYQPYILKPYHSNSKRFETKYEKAKNTDTESDAYSLYLNKSLKSDVVLYAQNVYTNVISLKNSTKNINRGIAEFKNYGQLDEFINSFDEDLRNFKNDYNRSYQFATQQEHSKNLVNYSEDLKQNVNYFIEDLNELGLYENTNGLLEYDDQIIKKYLPNENKLAFQNILNNSSLLFRTIHNITKDELTSPMAEHMNFKGLSFYYNYKYDSAKIDTFRLIESGMLLDIAL